MSRAWWLGFQRELQLLLRNKAQIINPLAFYLLMIMLFPLGVGADMQVLARIAPGVVWAAVLLSMMLSLERLFKEDHQTGLIEQWLVSPLSLNMLIRGKLTAHWLLCCGPFLLLAPLTGMMLGMSAAALYAVTLTVLVATPGVIAIGGIGAALVLNTNRGGLLLTLLVLPLFIPCLIVSTAAIKAAMINMPYLGYLALLVSFSVVSCTLAPIAIAAALRISTD